MSSTQWEYARLTLSLDWLLQAHFNTGIDNQLQLKDSVDDCLRKMGESGWELVAINERGMYQLIFKRPKS